MQHPRDAEPPRAAGDHHRARGERGRAARIGSGGADLVNDITGGGPTARQAPVTLLPALELALLQLWRRRRRADGSLTHAAYESLRATLTGNVQLVREVAFSPDGATLAAGNNDGTTLLWDADLPGAGAIADSIRQELGRDFTEAEQTEYLRGQDSAPVCPDPERRTAGEGGGDAGAGGRVTPWTPA